MKQIGLVTPALAEAAAKEGVSILCYIESHARCNGHRAPISGPGSSPSLPCSCSCHGKVDRVNAT